MTIRNFCRNFSHSSKVFKDFKGLNPNYQFKCGLEIHCQLKTKNKLFSNTSNKFNEKPNSQVSFFDSGLPGTLPKLNNEVVLLSIIAGLALNSKINLSSSFDRKHYFYADQPLGYQLTQRYNPICKGGSLKLNNKLDDIKESEKIITFDQIQIEQDTGKLTHIEPGISSITSLKDSFCTRIDLNRANVPLIEVVTNPDFENLEQVKAFVKKFQSIIKFLNISTGELESGSMRVDVNISVNQGNRIEIKNLNSTKAIIEALKYEYNRQIKELKKGNVIAQETRNWDGKKTNRLRVKESITDYRYMPDPELPPIVLDDSVIKEIKNLYVKTLPEDFIYKLVSSPYDLRVKDAKLLVNDTYPGLLEYYLQVFDKTSGSNDKIPKKTPGNLILHELIGELGKFNIKFTKDVFPIEKMIEVIELIYVQKKITNSSGKLLLKYYISNLNNIEIQSKTFDELIKEFELEKPSLDDDLKREIEEICNEIIEGNPQIVDNLKIGVKTGSLKYLIGQAMRMTQGKIKADLFEKTFKKIIGM